MKRAALFLFLLLSGFAGLLFFQKERLAGEWLSNRARARVTLDRLVLAPFEKSIELGNLAYDRTRGEYHTSARVNRALIFFDPGASPRKIELSGGVIRHEQRPATATQNLAGANATAAAPPAPPPRFPPSFELSEIDLVLATRQYRDQVRIRRGELKKRDELLTLDLNGTSDYCASISLHLASDLVASPPFHRLKRLDLTLTRFLLEGLNPYLEAKGKPARFHPGSLVSLQLTLERSDERIRGVCDLAFKNLALGLAEPRGGQEGTSTSWKDLLLDKTRRALAKKSLRPGDFALSIPFNARAAEPLEAILKSALRAALEKILEKFKFW